MGFLKELSLNILKKIGLGGSVHLYQDSALKQDGWFDSFRIKQSVDANGDPIPWYTYTFTHFLEPRLMTYFEVFEYGSGNSTRWYGQRVQRITAVEHDKDLTVQISSQLPANASIIHADLGQSYIESIKNENKKFDIISINGHNKVKCALYALDFLIPEGVLILNHSETEDCKHINDALEEQAFKRLDFWGMGPVAHSEFCSTVFYKKGNCLGI